MQLRTPQATRRNLALAREHAVHLPSWRKYHHRNTNPRYDPHNICRTAWEANHHDGYYYDMIHVLRHVAGGNLTAWWQHGQTRKTTISLITDALTLLGHHETPKRGRKRLSADQVVDIRHELDAGIPVAQIAAKNGVSANSVYDIRRGITHAA